MAEINLPALLNDSRYTHGGIIEFDMSELHFLQMCVTNAIWKDRAEAEAVLKFLIELADHECVRNDETLGGDLPKAVLRCIAILGRVIRDLEHPS